MRRCREDRWDFTEQDANFFPMYVQQGGELYGFCPAKATWDAWTVTMYKALLCAATTGSQWVSGGISEQPEWWIDLLSWFVARYDINNFTRKATMVLGDGDKQKSQGVGLNGTKQRATNRTSRA